MSLHDVDSFSVVFAVVVVDDDWWLGDGEGGDEWWGWGNDDTAWVGSQAVGGNKGSDEGYIYIEHIHPHKVKYRS